MNQYKMNKNYRYRNVITVAILPYVICTAVLLNVVSVQCTEGDGLVYVPYGSTFQFELCTDKDWNFCT